MNDLPSSPVTSIPPSSCSGTTEGRFLAFNTVIETKIVLDDGLDAAEAALLVEQLRAECERYESLLSRTRPTSDVARLNRSRGDFVRIERATWEALQLGCFYSAQSAGYFDITMGALTQLWDFRRKTVPDERAVAQALGHVGWGQLEFLDADGCYLVRRIDPELLVDVGGCAKGYIADRLMELLARAGVRNVYLSLGGNVAVSGTNERGRPWNIGVRNPAGPGVVGTVPLTAGSLVTSGVDERYFMQGGRRHHHILDCRTGRPAESDVASVTVISGRSSDGDGFSTALLCMGFERAAAFVEERPEIEAVFVLVDGTVRSSSGAVFAPRG